MKSAGMWYNRAMNWIKRLYEVYEAYPEAVFNIGFLLGMLVLCIALTCSGCAIGSVAASGDLVFPQVDMWWKG